MPDYLVNGTGLDSISLWYLRNNKIFRKRGNNRPWIFITGTGYDLDFLENQLDEVPWLKQNRDVKRDVYGEKEGIEIFLKASRINDIVYAVEQIGRGRKYSIYNADVNPVLRYISENNLSFFKLDDLIDKDIEISTATIDGKLRNGSVSRISINGHERDALDPGVLKDIAEEIKNSIVIVYNNERELFRKTLEMMSQHGYDLPGITTLNGSTYESYGQIHYKNPTVSISGKICIDSSSFIYSESGLTGLYEMSRTSSLPIVSASIATPGTAVSSMEESIAIRNGILIPLYKDDHEHEKNLNELLFTDRGGMTLQPEPGIYEDVYEIDFSSMYPSIIVRYNLSPETISPEGDYRVPDTPYLVDSGRRGFLSYALSGLLDKRLFYKSVKHLGEIYAKRDVALKWMLLTSFGYTGYKNAKFGKIEVHESITSIGRWALSTAMNLAEDSGFRVIHGIVDSLWIKGDGNVEELLLKIKEATRIDIVVDSHYKWIVFLPARSGLGSPGRYIGMRHDGSYKVRGIEIRRRDVPEISKKFQLDALRIFEDCRNRHDILEKRSELKNLEKRYIRGLRNFDREDFRINYHVTRHPEQYAVNNIQKLAMTKMIRRGVSVNPGERIPVIVVDRASNVIDLDENYTEVDERFYRDHLKRAFECFDYMVSERSGRKKLRLYDQEYSLSSR